MNTQQRVIMNDQALSLADREQLLGGILKIHQDQIENRLRDLGADQFDLLLPETRTLTLITRPDEAITGVVYGRYKQSSGAVGRGVLVATNSRVMLVDRKAFSVRCDQIAYTAITAITYNKVGLTTTITLHTRLGDINIRTFNWRCARNLIADLENRIFKVKVESRFETSIR